MRSARSVVQLFPHVAISFFYRAGSSPRARVWWPTEGLLNVKGCGPRKRATKVFFSKLRKLKNWILKGTRTKKQFSWWVRKYHFISGSTVKSNTYLLFCHFLRSGWPTWKLHYPFSDGKAISIDLSCFTRPNNTFFLDIRSREQAIWQPPFDFFI